MNAILIVSMFFTGIGAIALVYKARRGVGWCASLAGVLALAALVLAGIGLYSQTRPRQPDIQREMRYGEVVGRVMGAYLADNFEGNALVVTPVNFTDRFTVEQSMLDALCKQLGERIRLIGTEEPAAPVAYVEMLENKVKHGELLPGEMKMLLENTEQWFSTEVLYEIIRKQSEPIDLLVALLPLPVDFPRDVVRHRGTWPEIALLHPLEPNPQALLNTGKMAGLVVMKPLDEWKSPSLKRFKRADYAEVFDARYQLMTSENSRVDVKRLRLKER